MNNSSHKFCDVSIRSFHARRVATAGCEILDANGNVIAWTAEEHWAHLLVSLLTLVEALDDHLTADGIRLRLPDAENPAN